MISEICKKICIDGKGHLNENYKEAIQDEKCVMYCIYKITDLRNNEIIYIGKTKDFNQRRYYHFTQDKTPVQKYMLEEGRDHFKMEIIQDCIETNNAALKIEDQYIVEINPIMNKLRSGNIKKDNPNKYAREYMREYQKKYYKEHRQEYLAKQKAYREKKKLEKSSSIKLF